MLATVIAEKNRNVCLQISFPGSGFLNYFSVVASMQCSVYVTVLMLHKYVSGSVRVCIWMQRRDADALICL